MENYDRGRESQGAASSRSRILIVAENLPQFQDLVERLGLKFDAVLVSDPNEVLSLSARFAPDVILLQLGRPNIDGYNLCRTIKAGPMGPLTQIILVGESTAGREYLRAYEAGADDYVPFPVDYDYVRAKLLTQLRFRSVVERVWELNAQIQKLNCELECLVQMRSQELLEVRDLTIFALAKLAESRDPDTGEHLERISWYSRILAEELVAQRSPRLDVPPQFAEEIFRSAPLHDIGKVGIPDAILLKPGRLSPQEFEIMKQHTLIGYRALKEAWEKNPAGSFLARACEIARSHHERFDGTGYPDGLSGDAIPLAARVVSVADVFDALTSPRIYKKAIDPELARRIILREAGRQFDPTVVAAFERRWDAIQEIGKPFWDSLPPEKLERPEFLLEPEDTPFNPSVPTVTPNGDIYCPL